MKNYKWLAGLFLFASPAFAINYNATNVPSRGEQVYPLTATPLALNAVTISTRNNEPHLYLMRYSRDEAGAFSRSGVAATFALPALLNEAVQKEYRIKDVIANSTEHAVLVSVCESDECGFYSVSLGGNLNQATALKLTLGECGEAPFFISPKLVAQCTKVFNQDGDTVATVDGDILTGAANTELGNVILSLAGEQLVAHVGEEQYVLFTPKSDALPACDVFLEASVWRYFCILSYIDEQEQEEPAWRYEIKRGRLTSEHDTLAWVPNGDVSEAITEVKLRADKAHLFVLAQSVDAVFVENWQIAGQRYTSRRIDSTQSGLARWQSSQPDYLLFNVVRGRSADTVVVLDALEQKGVPSLASSFSFSSATGLDYKQKILPQDDHVLPEHIEVSWQDLPPFLSWDSQSSTLSGFVRHEDAGAYPSSLILMTSDDRQRDLSLEFNAVLTPAGLNVYEPTLFERWEIENPVPTSALASVPWFEFFEDKPISWHFTLQSREKEEVSLVWVTELPLWLSWDEVNYTLSGTPEQGDVGEITLRLQAADRYDAENIITFDLPMRLIEVDEPFNVISNGTATLSPGQDYRYRLEVTDEESDMSAMTISAVLYPNWLSWNDKTFELSGRVPDGLRSGTHLVQFTIRDEGGHLALHQFTLTVENDKPNESGGSLSWLWVVMLMIGTGLRLTK